MYQPLIKFHPYPAIITQVLSIFVLLETALLQESKDGGSCDLLSF